MHRIFYLAILIPMIAAAGDQVFVSKQTRVTTVELFTSEGCSSCPPAEQWLGRLKADPGLWQDVIPLAFHVDYWNYLGWKDRYASAAYSDRQRTYAEQQHLSTVYTPGILVNGVEYRGFFNPLTRNDAFPIDASVCGRLILATGDGKATLEFKQPTDEELIANLAYIAIDVDQPVKRGENAGHTLNHHFVVIDHRQAVGKASWSFDAPRPAHADAIVAWISRPDDLAPIQAVGGLLPAP